MSLNKSQTAIYCQGSFNIPDASSAQQQEMTTRAQELAAAGFGTVLLGQWHTHINDGQLSIYYNDTIYVSGGSNLQWSLSNIPTILKAGSVSNVMVTFGPFGSDFDAITTYLSQFQEQIQYLFDNFAIDGIDFDIEEELTPANQNTLAALTTWATRQGKVVTGAPYYNQAWWNQLLAEAPTTSWWNLQAYADNNDPTMYSSWEQGLASMSPQPSPPINPQSFLSYGFKPAADISTQTVTTTLKQIQQQYPGLSSAFIWRYEDIVGQAASYFQAIESGLS